MAKTKRKARGSYRLSFGGTAKKLYAKTLKAAIIDATYWVKYGQKRVCIDKVLPHSVKRIRCIARH